jgi:GAF domain-containing protein
MSQTFIGKIVIPMSYDIYDTNLRAFPSPKPLLDHEDVPFFGSLPDLLRSLQTDLGLEVKFVRAGGTEPKRSQQSYTVRVEGGKTPGHLVLLQSHDFQKPKLTEMERNDLLSSLAQFIGDAYRWQQAVRNQEECQASQFSVQLVMPVSAPQSIPYKPNDPPLVDLLKESAKILDCCASALYTLDSRQKTLKLRSCWGLPEERLLDPPRPLHDSLADLEAILGQTVVLNEDYLIDVWKIPEDFPSAVCVPMMSPQAILGTLWFYADRRWDFTEHELSLIEIISGRFAAELERASLLREREERKMSA